MKWPCSTFIQKMFLVTQKRSKNHSVGIYIKFMMTLSTLHMLFVTFEDITKFYSIIISYFTKFGIIFFPEKHKTCPALKTLHFYTTYRHKSKRGGYSIRNNKENVHLVWLPNLKLCLRPHQALYESFNFTLYLWYGR